jgi:hypothetical protein
MYMTGSIEGLHMETDHFEGFEHLMYMRLEMMKQE